MASKVEQSREDAQWILLNPKIPITVVHQRSKAERPLMADSRWRGRVRAEWGGAAGVVSFVLSTGYGEGEAKDWRMTKESVERVRGREVILRERKEPKARGARPKEEKVDPRQQGMGW